MTLAARAWAQRRRANPHLLLGVYALLTGTASAWAVLVSGPMLVRADALPGWIGFWALLLAFVLLRSYLAWWLAIFFAALGAVVGVVSVAIAVDESDWGALPQTTGIAALELAALVVLMSPAIEDWLEADRSPARPGGSRTV